MSYNIVMKWEILRKQSLLVYSSRENAEKVGRNIGYYRDSRTIPKTAFISISIKWTKIIGLKDSLNGNFIREDYVC
jgi:hypothetical protein